MTARITGFVTRADAGLRKPKSFSRNIAPEKGGVAPHYGGPAQRAAEPGASHERCIYTWKAWQDYHMDAKGWADIAYTGGFCNHGWALAGRGVGVRSAANGTNDGNYRFYAVTWIGGDGQTPTQLALDAADWWVAELREAGAGMAVKPHRYFKSTKCPGDPLVSYASSRDGREIHIPAPTPEVKGKTVFITNAKDDPRQWLIQDNGATYIGSMTLLAELEKAMPRFRDQDPAFVASVKAGGTPQ